MKKIFTILIILSIVLPVPAQLTFTTYLNQNNIDGLAEEGNYIWVGSTGGLLKRNKSTGALVGKYMMSDGLVSNDISCIEVDQYGNKWIATSSGVSKFDGSTFTNYQSGDGLLGNDVRGIAIDIAGNLWFGSTSGVSKFDGSTWTTYPTTHGVMDIATDEAGNVWAATWSGGAVKISDGEMTYYNTGNSNIPGDIVLCVEADNSGNIWFGFLTAGISKYDGTTWTNWSGFGTYVEDIAIDVLGNKWFANNPRVVKFDDASWTYYYTSDGLINNIVNVIEIDDQGNKWIGTADGLSRFDDINWSGFKTTAGLTNNDVKSLSVHNDGSIWIGTMDGVFVFDAGIWTHHDDVDLTGNEIMSICTKDSTTVWVGTTSGEAKYESGLWTGYTTADGFAGDYVGAIDIDHNGIIWFGSSAGVTVWDGVGTKRILIPGENVFDIYTAADGVVWVATNGNGLFLFAQGNYSSPNDHFTTSNSDLHTDYCRRLAQDSEGNMWIGGNTNVSVFDGSDFNFTNLSSYGFSSNSITGIDIDDLGNIWLSGSYNGILKHDGTNWVRYDADDGLAHNYTNAIAVDQDKNIWVGTDGGASKISCTTPEVDFETDIACWPASTHATNLSTKTDATTSYEWDIGNNGSVDYTTEDFSHQFPSYGAYNVKLTVINGHCSSSLVRPVQVFSQPDVNIEPPGSTTICDGTSVTLLANITNYDPNLHYVYSWSTGDTSSTIEAGEAGTYSVTVSHKECDYTPSSVNVEVTYPYDNAEICMVSVDEETNKNMIIWEKTPGEGIAAYNIYKLFGSSYTIVGQVPYDNLSVFVDLSSNPEAVSARYAITVVDTCGNESELSPYHQTIHLGASEGALPNQVVLDWTEYIDESGGFTYPYFYIYRGSSIGSLALYDSVSSAFTAYTDLDAQGNIYYRVGVKSPSLCVPNGNLKAGTGPYSHSLSNVEDNRLQTGANEPPTDITIDDNTIDEELAAASLVGRFTTSDPNAIDQHTYTLVSGTGDADNSSFTIVGDLLLSAEEFDYETKSSYSVRIRTTDDGTDNLYFEKAFTITINDVSETGTNQAPTNISIDNTSINENSIAGTMVGRFSTTDPNPDDSHSYTLVSGTGSTDNSSFAIAGNLLISAEIFDYETKSTYSIRVRSTDDGTGKLYFENTFTITIIDITETPANQNPTDISLNKSSMNENLNSGTLIGRFTTTDPDVADYHTYTLISGSGDTDNASFIIAGDALLSGEEFDFETKSSYSIRVRTTDNGTGNLYYEEIFTITITDVAESAPNSAPADISLDKTSIDENANQGTFIGRFTTSDVDTIDLHSYALVSGAGDNDNASFVIVGDVLISGEKFDYETKNSYTIRVRSTDNGSGNLSVEKSFAITINNLSETGTNHAPVSIALDNTTIDENRNAGTLIGKFTTTDDDTLDIHTYSLISGTGDDDNDDFVVAGNLLLSGIIFDYEAKDTFHIRIRSTDNGTGNLYVESTFTVAILNVFEPEPNQAPTDIALDNLTIDENKTAGVLVGRLSSVDPNEADQHTYRLVSGDGDTNNSSFTILGDLLLSATSFDYETKNELGIRIRTTDNGDGNLTYEKAFTITVINQIDVNVTNQKPEQFLIYPNPFRDAVILDFPNPDDEEFRLTITDLTGKVVRLTENITTGKYELLRNDLPAGYYFIELRGSKVYRGRIIAE